MIIIEVSENVLKELDQLKIAYTLKQENLAPEGSPLEEDKSTEKDLSDFIYVPSINLYVAKQRTHLGKN